MIGWLLLTIAFIAVVVWAGWLKLKIRESMIQYLYPVSGLTPLVRAVWRYLSVYPSKTLTMSYDKYERLCAELPTTWTFVDRHTQELGIEHRQLKGCIIRPI